MRFGFSTLGCPEWTIGQACQQARRLGYEGIELRLVDGQLVTPPVTEAVRARVRGALTASGVAVSALASSVRLAGPDTDATAAELRAGLALAADWSVPVVRVFGGRVPPGVQRHAWDALAPHVVEIQVKDGRSTPDGGWRQTPLGGGEVPVRDCLAVALAGGFDGWLVAEWEKFWQPDLDEPELALPAHRSALAGLLSDLVGAPG